MPMMYSECLELQILILATFWFMTYKIKNFGIFLQFILIKINCILVPSVV